MVTLHKKTSKIYSPVKSWQRYAPTGTAKGTPLTAPAKSGRGPALSAAATNSTAIFNGELGTKTNLQGSSKKIMDWLNVGSNGFAQLGNEQYFAKSKVEMKYLLELISDK